MSPAARGAAALAALLLAASVYLSAFRVDVRVSNG